MFEIRQVIQRLRMGESARQIARSQHVGRATVESIHSIALTQNWLDPLGQLPDDSTLARFFKSPRKAPQNVSSVEPFREEIVKWHAQGINATTIRRALHQKYGYSGSVHALYRFLKQAVPDAPQATIKLEFAVAEMAQVDFGMGPVITDRKTGEISKRRPGSSCAPSRGVVTSTPRLCATRASRRGSLVIATPSSGSTVCLKNCGSII